MGIKQKVIQTFEDFTQDIDGVFLKPWLKVAIVSNIVVSTGFSKSFVSDVFDGLYDKGGG